MPKPSRSHHILPDRKLALFSRHLPYEIRMLRATYNELRGLSFPSLLGNAYIESFCIHARNLTDFFKNESDLYPTWFTVNYEPKLPLYDPDIYLLLDQQIMHLSQMRVVGEGQIDATKRLTMYLALEAELSRFVAALSDKPLEAWANAPKLKQQVEALGTTPKAIWETVWHGATLQATGPLTATNHFTATTVQGFSQSQDFTGSEAFTIYVPVGPTGPTGGTGLSHSTKGHSES